MGLPPAVLKLVDTPLYGFSDHSVQPHRGVELFVTVGSHLVQAIVMSNFLIVDTLRVSNTIVERPTLNALQDVTSTYHLALKFSTLAGIGVIKGS